MTMNICAVCGGSFEAENHRFRYCSEGCRKVAMKRNNEKNNIREKHRVYMRKYREKIYQERMKNVPVMKNIPKENIDREREEHLRALREDIDRRAEKGEALANMVVARRENRDADFWKWFARYSIEFDEYTTRRTSRCLVNGISVYEDNFPQKVMEAIRRKQAIIITH